VDGEPVADLGEQRWGARGHMRIAAGEPGAVLWASALCMLDRPDVSRCWYLVSQARTCGSVVNVQSLPVRGSALCCLMLDSGVEDRL